MAGGDTFAEFSEQFLSVRAEAFKKVLEALIGALRRAETSAGDVWMYCFHVSSVG